MNNKQELFKIVSYGKYYYPAYTHYSLFPVNVRCDYCSKSNLECAIGLDDKDLCLRCVDVLTNKNNIFNNPDKLTDIYKQPQQPHIITRMMQDSVRRNPFNADTMTYMMQDSVRRNPSNIDSVSFMMQDSVRSNFDSDDDLEYDKKIKPYNF
jgi:hypothetical protein